jgi:hypothetical protein
VVLTRAELPVEALSLVRGIIETNFVLQALILSTVTLAELGEHDKGSRARAARSLDDFMSRMASEDDRAKLASYASANAGSTISFLVMAERAGMLDIYNGLYRYLSHFASHPSLSAAGAYLVEWRGPQQRVAYRPATHLSRRAIGLSIMAILDVCARFERSPAGTTSVINGEIHARLNEFGAIRRNLFEDGD